MVKFFIYNKKESIVLAKTLFFFFKHNTIYGFVGNYGVGKTFFIQSMISENVNIISDSFIFFNRYFFNGKTLYHLDLSKVNSYSEFSYFYSNFILTNKNIFCIEWIDKFYDCFDFFKKLILIEILFLEKDVRIFDICSSNNFIREMLIKIKSGMEQSGSLSGS